MNFVNACGDRIRVLYTIYNDPEQKEYERIFQNCKMLHEWMDQNEDSKTIRRMSIMYDYFQK